MTLPSLPVKDSTDWYPWAQGVDAAVHSSGAVGTNVKAYNAKGDGTTDDSAAIQAAIDATATAGGAVFFPAGTYLVGATLRLPSGVHLRGSGLGGDVFSSTDPALPFRGSVLKLKSGANVDLIKTAGFDSLTGTNTPGTAEPSRFGLHDLVLDGNKGGNTAGVPLRIFGRSYEIDHVIVQNGAAGGVYSESGLGGYDMEARWSNFQITDCAGDGLTWNGPHDSLFSNGTVARCDGHIGIKLTGTKTGGEMFANVHVWGNHVYQWSIGASNAAFLNCVSDGPGGVQVTGSGNTWIGGSIYGTGAPGENGITLGDGTTRTVGPNAFRTRAFNYSSGSIFHRLTANTTANGNLYQILGSLGGSIRYAAGQGKSVTTGALTFPVTSIAVADASSFPASGAGLYLGDGSSFTACSYTGKTGNTLTGVSGGGGSFTSGAAVFSVSGSAADDSWEITDLDNPSTGGFFQTAQSGTLTRAFLMTVTAGSQLRLDFPTQTVRTGSGATGSRPSASTVGTGAMFYDTTLGKPIWSNGSVWKDAAGTTV